MQWGQHCTLYEAMRLMLKLSLSKTTWRMGATIKSMCGICAPLLLKNFSFGWKKVLQLYINVSRHDSTFEILVNCWCEKMEMLWIVVFEAELANVLTRGPSFYWMWREMEGKTLKIDMQRIWWQYRQNETGQSGRNEILMYSNFFFLFSSMTTLKSDGAL